MRTIFNLAVLVFALSTTAIADVPESQQAEVEYLLNTLETSDCTVIRNGTAHTGAEGASHARRKYRYFSGQISSTEEFIEFSASKSTRSGKEYMIECPGQEPITSQAWLMKKLGEYRGRSILSATE